jgi:hypothetical protein
MYEVALLTAPGDHSWRRDVILPRGLEHSRISKYRILPTDELCDWLRSYTKSHATIEMISSSPTQWGNDVIIGVRFGFTESSDAVLFKLTWGGC